MMSTTQYQNGLLSPAPSVASTTAITQLPTPRTHPLKRSSAKEIQLLNYIDTHIRDIERRHILKFIPPASSDPTKKPGYVAFSAVLSDINLLLDMVWLSGTPHLQIPYLLTLAGFIVDFMPDFPFDTGIFELVNKFDEAFSDLIRAEKLDRTYKVRVRSLVEYTRVTAVNVAQDSGVDTTIDEFAEEDGDDADDDVGRALAGMYKTTMELLGDELGGLPVLEDDIVQDMEDNIAVETGGSRFTEEDEVIEL